MRTVAFFLAVCTCLLLPTEWAELSARDVQTTAAPAAADDSRSAIQRYCVTCHNDRTKAQGLSLEGADVSRPGESPEVWERVVRKLRTRSMPPQGVPRPDEATYTTLVSWLETELDRTAAAHLNPGRALIRRLNRSEYGNAVRDLLALDADVSSLLPPDDSAYGFDNISEMLGTSPALLERYLVAADRVSALAVGGPVSPGSDTYRIRQDRSQDQHIEGLPLGTVGGVVVKHVFPVDAEYKFSVTLYRTNLSAIRGLEHSHQVEITIDGTRVFIGTIGGDTEKESTGATITDRSDAVDARLQVRVPVKAGPHVVGATFVRKIGESTQRLRPFLRSSAGTYDSTGRPHIETMTIAGPFNPTGPGDTPSRRRVFTCRPANRSQEEACATKILSTLARRAFRRPVEKTDLTRLMTFFHSGRQSGTFDTGVQLALRRVLASPSFVFRVEDTAAMKPGAVERISDLELASRLSFFLWSSIPDEALLDLAARGRLSDPAVLDREVRRMIADPRANGLVQNFSGQWLHVRNLKTITPNHDDFPDFDDTLREAFQRETELFFEAVLREDHSALDLLTADYTFVNERLAKHYGIPYIYGSHFRRVTLADDARRGLLGKGALLMVTSHADRTSPTVRGKWILENILGTPPPPPLPNVPPIESSSGTPRTLRERLERHRASATCAGCHKVMDPLGFAMENFDAVGTWRTRDAGLPLDASGQLADGSRVDGIVALRGALLARSDVFVQTLTEKLMTYALGRGLQYYDMPAVRQIVRTAARQDYRFSAIMNGIVSSTPFQMRMSTQEDR
jgi:mono/diheme cytochrome c family protein